MTEEKMIGIQKKYTKPSTAEAAKAKTRVHAVGRRKRRESGGASPSCQDAERDKVHTRVHALTHCNGLNGGARGYELPVAKRSNLSMTSASALRRKSMPPVRRERASRPRTRA